MSTRLAIGLLVAAAVWSPNLVRAQTTASPPATSGWRDGFVLQSETGDYRLQFNALLQADGRFSLDDSDGRFPNTFAFRRIRPIFQARLARLFEFNLQPDFAGGMVNLRNAYAETRFSPAFRIRVGKDKTPFGLERLQSALHLFFMERALPTAIAPDRDVGLQVLGDAAGGLLSYSGGLFNGVVDGGSGDLDSNDGKDLAGRVVVRPFARKPEHALAGFGIGIAGTTGTQPSALPVFRTSSLVTFFTYRGSAVGEGTRSRVSPQVFYAYKAFAAYGEYVRSTGRVELNGVGDDITHQAWQIAGAYVLTGERASDRGVRPAVAFDPSKGQWGAVQLVARYHAFEIDPEVISLGLAGTGDRKASGFAIGANWYLNPFVKWVLNFERTTFDGPVSVRRPAEVLVLFRNQLNF